MYRIERFGEIDEDDERVGMFVRLSAPSAYLKNYKHVQSAPNCQSMMSVAVRGSSGGSGIRYVLLDCG